MKWRYYFPHVWDDPRQGWEDVWLRPGDPSFFGVAYFITVESFRCLAAHDADAESIDLYQQLRADTQTNLWVHPYDGSAVRLAVRVRAETFSRQELVEWTRLFLLQQGHVVDALEAMSADEIVVIMRHVYDGVRLSVASLHGGLD